jgi:ABC-2 type transport system ATP-binding protein
MNECRVPGGSGRVEAHSTGEARPGIPYGSRRLPFPSFANCRAPWIFVPVSAAVELESVSKRYGDFRAVDGLSLSVPEGCIYGVLGPNGAGKTTTLRMILGVVEPTSGRVSVLGHGSAMSIRERVGYLPEEKGLYRKMKASAVIAYFATLKGMSRRQAELRARELLDRHGLGLFADVKTEALSKGMGQKVQVLASIAHDPDLVILDEPFSGLDPVNQGVLEEIVRDLKERGRTVLLSTHVMAHAERLCDRVVIISGGRSLFDGTLAEARRVVPAKVRIRTNDSLEPLQDLPMLRELRPLGDGRWEFELEEGADPQAVLEACFTNQVRLSHFSASEATLHDAFVRLVGPAAREASYR